LFTNEIRFEDIASNTEI